MIVHLDVASAKRIIAREIADPPPIRDATGFESAVLQSQHSAFGEDAYETIFDKAGAILFAVVKFHPLVDGNKRAGWLLSAAFLAANGLDLSSVSNDDVYDTVIKVAEDATIERPWVSARLHQLWLDQDGDNDAP